jgi:hypothetical protein
MDTSDKKQASAKRGEVTTKISRFAHEINKNLARRYGANQRQVMDAAHILFMDHVDGVDAIQVPELMSSVTDLEETVGRLILQMECLERLAYEIAGFQVDRS